MPDIDINPSALARQDSLANGSTTPSGSGSVKPLSLNTSAQKAGKSVQSVPRVDLFPLYAILKSSIGDGWTRYKEAVSKYILGALSQDELARQIDPLISSTDANLNAHNQLISAIQSNVLRDAPETAVASWVSANDKPTSVSKPVSGDAAEQRLRTEVMLLPPRTRHRLKGVQDEPANPITTSIHAINMAKRPNTSTAQASGLAAASAALTPGSTTASAAPSLPGGGSSSTAGLTKDAEIRRRYAQPLAQEAHDLPSLSAMTDRILPICYEEGLQSGTNPPNACAELLLMALETMLKSEINTFLGRVRANAPTSRPPLSAVEPSGLNAPLAAPAMERTVSATGSIAPPPLASLAMERTASHLSVDAGSVSLPASTGDTAPAASGGISTSGLGTTQLPSITTSAFKKQLAHEEALYAQGLVKRTDMGLLPCEVASLAAQGGGRGVPGDLRLAWQLGGHGGGGQMWWAGLTPWLGERVALEAYAREEWAEMYEPDGLGGAGVVNAMHLPPSPPDSRDGSKSKMPGGPITAAAAGDDDTDMPDAEGDADSDAGMPDADTAQQKLSWAGAGLEDRDALGSLLDDCLSVGM